MRNSDTYATELLKQVRQIQDGILSSQKPSVALSNSFKVILDLAVGNIAEKVDDVCCTSNISAEARADVFCC